MNHFHLVSLFPDMFDSFTQAGILGRAKSTGLMDMTVTNPRDFTSDRHRSVDDAPYGGGSGMVMMPGPILSALEDIDARAGVPVRRILLTPQGKPFVQADARRLVQEPAIALVCGRYEGIDERARSVMHEELSIGDFVLFGGEVAAMAIVEAVARLIPGVLGNAESVIEESHSHGLLEYPQYTRPAEFRGQGVPDVLLSGNHGAIRTWRRHQALIRTARRRPELMHDVEITEEERLWLNEATERGEA